MRWMRVRDDGHNGPRSLRGTVGALAVPAGTGRFAARMRTLNLGCPTTKERKMRSLDPAQLRRTIEQKTCEYDGHLYRFTVQQARAQRYSDPALPPHMIELQVLGTRDRAGCAMSPGIPFHVVAWVTAPEEIAAIVHEAWREAARALRLKAMTPQADFALPSVRTAPSQAGFLASVRQYLSTSLSGCWERACGRAELG